jgi:Tfp pilus assembly major pilin PilA
MFCKGCGTEVSEGTRFCANCGRPLDVQPAGGEEPQGDAEYWEVAVGPKRTNFYLSKFERFARGGGFVSWNWPAFFVTLVWMLYRKMWLCAALYFFALPIVIGLLFAALYVALPEPAASSVGWAIQLGVVFVVIPMFANALYYRVVQERIREAKASSENRERQLRALAGTGGTSNAAFIVVLVGIVPVVGILAAIAIPAYQDYTIRAQVSEGLNLAAAAKAAVAETFIGSGSVPEDRQEAGMTREPTDSSGVYVRSVQVVGGRIDIVYGGAANPTIANRTLSITPYGVQGDADGWSVVWRCGYGVIPAAATHEIAKYQPGTIEPKYLPSACRPH